MYNQFFGNYLLSRGVINTEQLLQIFHAQTTSRIRIGALAIQSGFMTAREVEQVLILQTHNDKRFGKIAVEEGYLEPEQLDMLLKKQVPDFILLGQILIDDNILTHTQLEELITDYQSEYEICDLDMSCEQKEMVEHLIKELSHTRGLPHINYVAEYLTLLFNNLIRFIGEDFTPLEVQKLPEIPGNCCTTQQFESPGFCLAAAFDMEPDAAVEFASRYACESFDELDEYVKASIEDFLNLHNGLFIVNMSNEYSMEINLEPPVTYEQKMFSTGKPSYLLPILYPFGTIYFIWSILD